MDGKPPRAEKLETALIGILAMTSRVSPGMTWICVIRDRPQYLHAARGRHWRGVRLFAARGRYSDSLHGTGGTPTAGRESGCRVRRF
jgi:hypothetical protein